MLQTVNCNLYRPITQLYYRIYAVSSYAYWNDYIDAYVDDVELRTESMSVSKGRLSVASFAMTLYRLLWDLQAAWIPACLPVQHATVILAGDIETIANVGL